MILVRHSVLEPASLLPKVLQHYRLGEMGTCQLMAHSHDDLYAIESGESRFVLRVYAVGNDLASIESQAHILQAMHDAGLPVAQAICSDSGAVMRVAAPEGLRCALLYARRAGSPASRDITVQQAAAYGRLVARVHAVADAQQLTAPLHIDLDYLIDKPLRLIQPALLEWPHISAKFAHLSRRIKSALNDLMSNNTNLSVGLCHGDLHKSNLLVDAVGRVSLIDWDCVGMGWRTYDLAILRWSIGPAMGNDGIGEPRLSAVWQVYLDSYTQQRPLSADEMTVIPYFVAARHIRVLGWEVDRALNGIAGAGFLNERYFDWWIDTLETWSNVNHLGQ